MFRNVRLFVSDIDGTLLDKDKKITKQTIQTIKEIRNAGIKLCFSTNRPLSLAKIFLQLLENGDFLAILNGGQILNHKGEVISCVSIDNETTKKIAYLFVENKIEVWVYGAKYLNYKNHDGYKINPIEFLLKNVEDLKDTSTKIVKISGISKNNDVLNIIKKRIPSSLSEKIRIEYIDTGYINVLNPVVDKGYVIRYLSNLLNINSSDVACIGDADNDIPMFQASGLSIAMGQSNKIVKSYAHFVTEDNKNNGWAKAVRQFFLQKN